MKLPELIQKIEELSAKASPKWQRGFCGNANVIHYDGDDVHPVANVTRNADRELMLLSRTAMPLLVEAMKRAQDALGYYATSLHNLGPEHYRAHAEEVLAEIESLIAEGMKDAG